MLDLGAGGVSASVRDPRQAVTTLTRERDVTVGVTVKLGAEVDEVLERLRLGLMITVMAGSMNDNVPFVFEDVESIAGGLDHIAFCADDRHVQDLLTTADHLCAFSHGTPLKDFPYRIPAHIDLAQKGR